MNVKSHIPVMANELVAILMPTDGKTYLDGTFGAGGYTRALLEAADCKVWGIDRDPIAVELGHQLAAWYSGRLTVLRGRYSKMAKLLGEVGVEQLDGIALDIGISSMQINDASRGFSFAVDGPLDMRMGNDGETVADIVNRVAEKELADIIYQYGEERASRRVAKAIVELRQRTPITRTGQLADLVRRVVARSGDGIDPATRTFQALRIYVNDELGELETGLAAAEQLLAPGGRLAVVSFHSLEDRRVKRFFQTRSGSAPRPSRHEPEALDGQSKPTFKLLKRGAARPKTSEIDGNPRARSARLRWAERTSATGA